MDLWESLKWFSLHSLGDIFGGLWQYTGGNTTSQAKCREPIEGAASLQGRTFDRGFNSPKIPWNLIDIHPVCHTGVFIKKCHLSVRCWKEANETKLRLTCSVQLINSLISPKTALPSKRTEEGPGEDREGTGKGPREDRWDRPLASKNPVPYAHSLKMPSNLIIRLIIL